MTLDGSQTEAAGTVPCIFCGEPEYVGLAEVWTDHRFTIEACCEDLHEAVVRDMADAPAYARQLLRRLDLEEVTGHALRRLADDGCCGMVLDWQLDHRPVTLPAARAFVARPPAHCGPPVTWRFGVAVWNGHTMVGVAMVGNPVARAFNGRGVLEVNRLCVRRDMPRALAWNAASMLYGWCAREAERRGWAKIITYTRTDEEGMSLVAAGWAREAITRGRGWHSRTRQRSNTNGWIDKVRWGKHLRPRRACKQEETGQAPPPRVAEPLLAALFDGSPGGGDRLFL